MDIVKWARKRQTTIYPVFAGALRLADIKRLEHNVTPGKLTPVDNLDVLRDMQGIRVNIRPNRYASHAPRARRF